MLALIGRAGADRQHLSTVDAGLVAGSTVVAVNGLTFTGDETKRAVAEASNGGAIYLLV